jgi:hypothetical protein
MARCKATASREGFRPENVLPPPYRACKVWLEGTPMTEQEWMDCTDPTPMLQFLASRKNKRKLAMFGVARCRHISRLCSDERGLIAIDVSERYADRKAKINEVRVACRNAREDESGIARPLGQYVYEIAVLCNGAFNAFLVSEYALKAALDQSGEKALQCTLLREIFGNPFRRIRISRHWLTPAVKQLAEKIYAESSFGYLRMLADALEEAGCTDAAILDHCRSKGPHVKGCWVIDVLLAKRQKEPSGVEDAEP